MISVPPTIPIAILHTELSPEPPAYNGNSCLAFCFAFGFFFLVYIYFYRFVIKTDVCNFALIKTPIMLKEVVEIEILWQT